MGSGAGNGSKHTNYAIGCLVACVIVELTSIGCTVRYSLRGDEADSRLSLVAYVVTAAAVAGQLGQLLSRYFISYITHVSKHKSWSKRDGIFAKAMTYGVGILAIPSLGPLQLAATILMTVSTANDDSGPTQGYASVIVGLNFTATILAVAFGVFFYVPMKSDKDSNYIPL